MEMWTPQEEAKRLEARLAGLNKAKFARENKIPGGASMISQHISGNRPIGIDAALAYARAFNCKLSEISPRLAAEIEQASHHLSAEPIETPAWLKNKIADEIYLEQFDTGGSMGKGVILRDQPGVIQSWKVSKEWLNKNVKSHSGAQNLCIVTGFGDSMRPMFNPGDPLLVDRGVTSVDFDAVYFFRVGDEGFLKRLQKIPGEGLRVISTNKEYESWTIRQDMDFEVFGRVLKVWCSEDF